MFLLYAVEGLFADMFRAVKNEDDESKVLRFVTESAFINEPFAYAPNIECDVSRTRGLRTVYCKRGVYVTIRMNFCSF